jgi:hypothetical protein
VIAELFPSIDLDEVNDRGVAIVKDMKEMKLAAVKFKENILYCEQDKTTDCKHTRFMWAHKDMTKMYRYIHEGNSKRSGSEVVHKVMAGIGMTVLSVFMVKAAPVLVHAMALTHTFV